MIKKRQHSQMLSEQLRQVILESGESRYHISKETGVTEATLSRFVNGKQALSQEKIDILGEYLGLRLVVGKKRRKEEQ